MKKILLLRIAVCAAVVCAVAIALPGGSMIEDVVGLGRANAETTAIKDIVKESAQEDSCAQILSATIQGFGGEVTVTVGLDENDVVTYLSVETPNETDGIGKCCSEPAFTDQFIGKTAPFTFGENDIDAVSGATITSTAVLDALTELVPHGAGLP